MFMCDCPSKCCVLPAKDCILSLARAYANDEITRFKYHARTRTYLGDSDDQLLTRKLGTTPCNSLRCSVLETECR